MAKKQRSSLLTMAQQLRPTRGGPPHWSEGLSSEQVAEITELAVAKREGKLPASWNELGRLVLKQVKLPRINNAHHMAHLLAQIARRADGTS